MKHRWLTLFSIAFIGFIVMSIFWMRLQPIEIPTTEEDKIVPGSITSPAVTFVNPSLGAGEDAELVIVEYSDFECAACAETATLMRIAVGADPSIKYVWKNMPNESTHPMSTPAAIAAHCAGNQGKFWEYHEGLFNSQYFLSEATFTEIAQQIGLDMAAFQTCYDTREPLPLIKQDYEEGLALGITATPTIFIGNDRYSGAPSIDDLFERIEQAKENQ